jgi:RimJ/RimL family protein N-acetyltransferase
MNLPLDLHPVILKGELVELLPLEKELFDELYEAASDKKIWEFYVGDWSDQSTFNKVYTEALNLREQGLEYPFVIKLKSNQQIIGSTRLLDIGAYNKRLEIGGTWLMPQYWATAINFDCKLSLLTFCFDEINANRVQLKTQHDNLRSRKAIEKIGGKYEGILRQHMLKDDGSFRSSAYFSILKEEWSEVKFMLENKLYDKIKEF